MKEPISFLGTAAALLLANAAAAQQQAPVVAMSPPWAQSMCTAWNADPGLTEKLAESGWVKNDAGRGFKAMQIYRADCPSSARVELQVVFKDGKAMCNYGGAAKTEALVGNARLPDVGRAGARWAPASTGR